MTITGWRTPIPDSRRIISSPLMPGMRTSVTMQPGASPSASASSAPAES